MGYNREVLVSLGKVGAFFLFMSMNKVIVLLLLDSCGNTRLIAIDLGYDIKIMRVYSFM